MSVFMTLLAGTRITTLPRTGLSRLASDEQPVGRLTLRTCKYIVYIEHHIYSYGSIYYIIPGSPSVVDRRVVSFVRTAKRQNGNVQHIPYI